MGSFFNKFFFAIFDKFFLKKFNSFEFKFFKLFLQVEVVSCIVDFDNDNYEFVKAFVRFFFVYKFFFNINFKFLFKYIHFEVVVSIRFVKMYFETLSVIDCKRLLSQILYNSFECNDFVDDFEYDTYFFFNIIVIRKNSCWVLFVVQMLYHNWFNSFHDFFFHTSNCEQCFLSFFSLIEDEINVQLQKSILKVHAIINIHEWLCYLYLRFLKNNIVALHVYVFKIIDVLLLSLVGFASVRGRITLFWHKHF